MDQSKLDPKLKEAYDRVMGTSLPAKNQPAKPAAPATPPAPPAPPPFKPMNSFAPQLGQTTTVMRAVSTGNAPPPVVQPKSTNEKVKISSGMAQVSETTSGGLSLPTILLFLAAFIFFVVYTLFWLKFFTIELPFDLPF